MISQGGVKIDGEDTQYELPCTKAKKAKEDTKNIEYVHKTPQLKDATLYINTVSNKGLIDRMHRKESNDSGFLRMYTIIHPSLYPPWLILPQYRSSPSILYPLWINPNFSPCNVVLQGEKSTPYVYLYIDCTFIYAIKCFGISYLYSHKLNLY